ncbi:methylated-DNA--[protein]-cysteine S-methyltransferase [Chloroflexota bacterium]
MTQELNYTVFDTTAGWLGILGTATAVRLITLPKPSRQGVLQLLGDNIHQSEWSQHRFTDLIQRLKLYFSGQRVSFPDQLDFSTATAFQRQVWEATRLIPFGETRSYSWIAEQVGKPSALRAVGNALGRNPMPIIIPCHRVLAKNGTLGGFSGGLEVKRHLLSLEASGSIE